MTMTIRSKQQNLVPLLLEAAVLYLTRGDLGLIDPQVTTTAENAR